MSPTHPTATRLQGRHLFVLYGSVDGGLPNDALWFRKAINKEVSTGPLAGLLVLLTYSLAYSIALLRSFVRLLVYSLPNSWESERIDVSDI